MDGSNWDYCPRAILTTHAGRGAAQRLFPDDGRRTRVLPGRQEADGTLGVADAGDTLAKPCYGQLSLLRNADFLTTLITYFNELGYGVYQNDHEDANGQFEINWRFADALKTADQVSFFKFMVKALAEERGLCATFMPKPFAHLTGSGAHHHLSLWDADGQRQSVSGQERPARAVVGRPVVSGRPARPCQSPVRADRPVGQFLQALRGALAPVRRDLGAGLYRAWRQQPDHDGARPRAGPFGISDGGLAPPTRIWRRRACWRRGWTASRAA